MRFWVSLILIFCLSCGCSTTKLASPTGPFTGIITLPALSLEPAPAANFQESKPVFVVHIQLNGRIGPELADRIHKQLAKAQEQGAKAILLEINSEGGEYPSGLAISKNIEEIPIPVVCVVDTMAMSMGFYILQSCDQRLMTKRSWLMIHQVALMAQPDGSGTQDDWRNLTDTLKTMNEALSEHEARRMSITPAQLRDRTPGSVQWLLEWQDALKFGAIDGAVDTVNEVNMSMIKGEPIRTTIYKGKKPNK